MKDAFDVWQEWASKPPEAELSIPSDLLWAVACLAPKDQFDRDKVNEAVRKVRDPGAQFVWIYENGDQEKTFHSEREAETWLAQNDAEGVLFKYRLGPRQPPGSADRYGVPLATE
jgi:hypothetical protein